MNAMKLLQFTALAGTLIGTTLRSDASVLIDYDLGATEQNTTTWTTLTSANPSRTPDSGTGTLSVGSPAFQASSGIYSWMGDYSVTVTQSSVLDIESVVFQLELSPNPDYAFPYSGGPLLTITTTSGSVQLAASWFAATGSETLTTSMGSTTYTAYSWQWDLSSYADTITSVSITAPISIHSSTIGAQIDTSSSMLQVVPEPSSALLSCLALGFAWRRRR
jgi:PEP-CTERM motif